MSVVEMKAMAARENAAARQRWDDVDGSSGPRKRKNITARIGPYIGRGMTQVAVARELGCSVPSVCYALKKLGARL